MHNLVLEEGDILSNDTIDGCTLRYKSDISTLKELKDNTDNEEKLIDIYFNTAKKLFLIKEIYVIDKEKHIERERIVGTLLEDSSSKDNMIYKLVPKYKQVNSSTESSGKWENLDKNFFDYKFDLNKNLIDYNSCQLHLIKENLM